MGHRIIVFKKQSFYNEDYYKIMRLVSIHKDRIKSLQKYF